jgi:hypothetical protein
VICSDAELRLDSRGIVGRRRRITLLEADRSEKPEGFVNDAGGVSRPRKYVYVSPPVSWRAVEDLCRALLDYLYAAPFLTQRAVDQPSALHARANAGSS